MIYLKSFLAALAALIGYILLLLPAVYIWMDRLVPRPASLPDNVGYISSSNWIPVWPLFIGAIVVFLAAFFRTFRRISVRRTAGQ